MSNQERNTLAFSLTALLATAARGLSGAGVGDCDPNMYFAANRGGRVVAVFVGDELEAAVAFADAYAPDGTPLAIVVSDRLAGRVYANAASKRCDENVTPQDGWRG